MERMNDVEPKLTRCPCGAVAVWYCVVLYVQGGDVMRAHDFYDDLCDDCFRSTVADEDREGWLLHSTAKHHVQQEPCSP